MQNRSGLRTDPLDTPLVIDGFCLFVCFVLVGGGGGGEYVPFTSTHCRRSCKQDRKKDILAMLKLYVDSFFSKNIVMNQVKSLAKIEKYSI